jgi:hypothetical protein
VTRSHYARFGWRLGRNLIAASPARGLLFARDQLADRFSCEAPHYALSVFRAHRARLDDAGAPRTFQSILELGPGTAIGVSLLFWADSVAAGMAPKEIVLWDAYANMRDLGVCATRAAASLAELAPGPLAEALRSVVGGKSPPLRYELGSVRDMSGLGADRFELVYSQSALECVWEIEACWRMLVRSSAVGAWHSHQMNLMDHGRHANYLEMCEWSRAAYFCSMRWIPGAPNRWRAGQHLQAMQTNGLDVITANRLLADEMPIRRRQLAEPFRSMPERELLTTVLQTVARRRARGRA